MAKKRGNGEGTITQYKDGRWCGRYTITTSEGPKRKAIYGKTKEEVRKKLTKAMADRDKGLIFDVENPTVGKYLERWLTNSVKDSVKQRTFENYEYVVRVHLIPALGSKKLNNLSPAQVQELYRQKLDSGLSNRTVRLIHTTLHRALKQAVKWGMIPRNVTEAVDLPRVEKKEMTYLNPEQIRAFLKAAEGDRLEALYTLAITAGLREGELLGLRWQDVDLESKVVQVQQQLTRTKSGLSFTTPKSNKGRQVSLMDITVNTLKDHRKRQLEEKMRLGSLWEDTDLVFTNSTGGPMDVANLTYRSFRPLLKKAGLPQIRFHDLRHSCATLFFSNNTQTKIVQDMLGHSQSSVTTDIYSHVLPNMQSEAVREVEANLF